MIIDPSDGTIVAANRAAGQFYGFPTIEGMKIDEINLLSADEIAAEMHRAQEGMKIRGVVHPDFRSQVAVCFRRVGNQGRAAGEAQIVTKSGESRWWNVAATAISRARFLAFAALNLIDPDRKHFGTLAVTGAPDVIERASGILGGSLVGSRWRYDAVREGALGTDRTVVVPSLRTLGSHDFPSSVAEEIERSFNLGEITITRIMESSSIHGDFTLLFASGEHIQNQALLELYTGMVAVTLNRLAAERRNVQLVREKEILLKEVQHRVKNNLNTMTSMLSLQAHEMRGNQIAQEVLNDVRGRFRSMAILYDRLYRSDTGDAGSVTDYLETLGPQLVALFPSGNRVVVSVTSDPSAPLDPDQCVLDARRLSTVGLILNELVTNAMKYAFAADDPPSLTDASAISVLAIQHRQERGWW